MKNYKVTYKVPLNTGPKGPVVIDEVIQADAMFVEGEHATFRRMKGIHNEPFRYISMDQIAQMIVLEDHDAD